VKTVIARTLLKPVKTASIHVTIGQAHRNLILFYCTWSHFG
jgi:hypothetical protein